ncbi:putative arginine--tRNA ligase, mitochondrial [Glandiceps talaboti]
MVNVAMVTKKMNTNFQFSVSLKKLANIGFLQDKDSRARDERAERLARQVICNDHLQAVKADKSFLHFKVDQTLLTKSVLEQVLRERQRFGLKSDLVAGPRDKVIVEYSSPNIAKPFHAGHLRSTVIGHFIANLNTALGHDVIRMNFLGDWGVQFGLLGVGFARYGSESELSSNPIQHLFNIYVRINQEAALDETVFDKAREYFRKLEHGDEEAISLWQRFRDLSIKEYTKIYKRLGVYFDVYSGESMYGQKAQQIIEQLKQCGLLVTTERGVGVVDLSPNMSPDQAKKFYSTLVRSDGTTLYITRDIAAAIDRHDNHHFDRMYYVVDKGQDAHFKQLFGTLKVMGNTWEDRCKHVRFGKVLGMSTRKGEVVFLQDILDEAKTRMIQNMKNSQTTKVEILEDVAETLAISAIVTFDLKNNLESDYKFDWGHVLQSHGDTGVYLQYTHARLCSIENLCGISLNSTCDTSPLVEQEAIQLIQQIAAYEDAVCNAYQDIQPKYIVGYLFRLSRLASIAHKRLIVKGSPDNVAQARLLLFKSARQTLANGMRLLGISPLDQM